MSGPQSHHYLVALADGGGTVPAELGVVRRLVERGHRVTALVDESMAGASRATGAAVRTWGARPSTEFRDWAIKNPLELAKSMSEHYLSGPAAGHAADTLAAIDGGRPDLIVTTFFTLGAMIAAEARAVPFDVLMPNVYIAPVPGRPPGGAGMRPMRGPLGAMRDRMAAAATTRLLDRYTMDPLNAVRVRHGLDPIVHVWDQVHRARRELVLTTAEFEFDGEFPPNVRFVGPVLDDPAWAVAERFDPPPGDAPLVLVALSSTFQNHADCLQRIADALGTLPVRGYLTTGPSIPPELIDAPVNTVVVASAPHREAMRRASLVVTHGGHGTVMKALAAGLPLVVLHHGRDQADNAARIVKRGAGVTVPRRAPADEIAAAIEKVLGHERYRAAAARLGEAINRDVAANALLAELEQLAPVTAPPRSP
ncbi:glycosyltransferase [Agromyces italicus]|uniref:glycosyltransferase n=1 Tax=Agromyces italicus TaxID=279572 RepID=UPI0003B51A0B|nr:nucleotide disphospho-sugar-binding domain-containing protein [Agromyces italicus]